MCMGLFCNIDEIVTENFECRNSSEKFQIPEFYNATYVYFKPNRQKLKNETDSEKYWRSLKSNLSALNTKRIFDADILVEIFTLYSKGFVVRMFLSLIRLISMPSIRFFLSRFCGHDDAVYRDSRSERNGNN